MYFSEIVAQKHITENLKNHVIHNKAGHAYAFSGPAGIGKRTISMAFAGALMCLDPIAGEACGVCTSCKLFKNGTNPDFHEVGADDENILIDEIRAVQRDIYIKPLYGKRKVYLISQGERMTVQAQNCLLKILEEPPGYAVLLLTLIKFESLLKTIQSRVPRFRLAKYQKNEVVEILRGNGISLSREEEFVVNYCNGIPKVALNLSANEDFKKMRNETLDILVDFLVEKKPLYKVTLREFLDTGKSDMDVILDMIQVFFRDVLMYQLGERERMYLINTDKTDLIDRCAAHCASKKLIDNIGTIEKIKESLKQNVNFQLCIDNLVIGIQEEQ